MARRPSSLVLLDVSKDYTADGSFFNSIEYTAMTPTFIFSNNWEELLQQFDSALFSSAPHPFAKRYLIVPNQTIREWVTLTLARQSKNRILTGVHCFSLYSFYQQIIPALRNKKEIIPSVKMLALAIEQWIRNQCQRRQSDLDDALLSFLQIPCLPVKSISSHQANALISLSCELASLFQQYALFHPELAAEWDSSPAVHWQQKLWQAVHRQKGWTHWARVLADFHLQPLPSSLPTLHLFGFSTFPPLFLNALLDLSQSIPSFWYLFSPCATFWSDLCSDRERVALQRLWKKKGIAYSEQSQWIAYFLERNPLLANISRLIKQTTIALEKQHGIVKECYTWPKNSSSLLSRIQTDFLELYIPDGKKRKIDSPASIEIHNTRSPFMEVFILRKRLKHLLETKEIAISSWSEILILSAHIEKYAPALRALFPSHFPLKIAPMATHSSLLQGWLLLLDLVSNRWEVSSLLSLFSHPAFQRAHGLQPEQVDSWKEWIDKARIDWGYSAEHKCKRAEYEGNDDSPLSPEGTWEAGFSLLLRGIYGDPFCNRLHSPPSFSAVTDAPCLGKLIELIRQLYGQLLPFIQNDFLPWQRGIELLQSIFQTHFAVDFSQPSACEQEAALQQELLSFSSQGSFFGSTPFSARSLVHHLERDLRHFHRNTVAYTFDAIACLPLKTMAIPPAKILCLLGLNDDDFPRSSFRSPFNHMPLHRCPTSNDEDRMAFLEALFAAREKLLLFSSSSEKTASPSLLIKELLDYIDDTTDISPQQLQTETLCSYHLPPSPLLPQPQGTFLTSLPTPLPQPMQRSLSLFQLQQAIKSPLHSYFTEQLLFQWPSLPLLQPHHPFALSTKLLQKSVQQQLQSADRMEETDSMLHPTIEIIRKNRISIEMESAIKRHQDNGIDFQQCYTVELYEKCNTPFEYQPGFWVIPALSVFLPDRQRIVISGTLPPVCPQGLVCWQKNTLLERLQMLPLYWTFLQIADFLPWLKERHCFFLKSSKSLSISCDQAKEDLAHFLRYCSLVQQHPPLFLPQWISFIIREDRAALCKEWKKLFSSAAAYRSSFIMQYWNCCFSPQDEPPVQQIISQWKSSLAFFQSYL